MLVTEQMRALEILLAVAVLSGALPAAAQSALIVRSDGMTSPPIEAAIDAALREASGGSLRRIDSSLEELTLASGCAHLETGDGCLGALAAAANAEELWLQHLSHDGAGWRIRLEVHSGDGARVWSLDARCEDPEACGALVAVRLDARRGADAAPNEALRSRSGRVRSERARATPDPLHAASPGAMRARRQDDVVPPVLFTSGAVVGSAAIAAGVLAITFAGQDSSGERRRDRDEVPMSPADVSVAVGATLGTVAVALAFAGGLYLVLPQHPHALALTRDGVAFSF